MTKINQCKCGANSFYLKETLMHTGDIDDDGDLYVSNIDNGIDTIVCTECEQEYDLSEFNNIYFN